MFESIKKEIKRIMNNLDEMQITIDSMKRHREETQKVMSMRVSPRLYTISYEDGKLKRTFI